jgi:hypothetical protein
MGAFTATVMGVHAADCLTDVLRGKAPHPLSFAYLAQGIALGRRDAIFFSIYPDDKAYPPYFTGRLGYWIRAFGVVYLRFLVRSERRPGFLFVLGKGRYTAAKRKAERQLAQVRQSG